MVAMNQKGTKKHSSSHTEDQKHLRSWKTSKRTKYRINFL